MLKHKENNIKEHKQLYEVYEVLYKGVPVYIGSGIQNIRHLHVKSGASHNAELNKLFFSDPDNIVVQILRTDLSKEESLEMEKEYIQATQPKFNVVHTNRNKKVGVKKKK